MPACSICFERFSSPVSLPCGHVFCRECIRRTIASQPSTSGGQHACPSCRSLYTLQGLNPALVPAHLRPYILPPVRPVYFDADSSPASSPGSSHSASASGEASASEPMDKPARTQSDLAPPSPIVAAKPMPMPMPSWEALTANRAAIPPADIPLHAIPQPTLCRLLGELHTWRRRAETHAAGNTSLLAFARSAKEYALRMRAERDSARSRCTLLKRKLVEVDPAYTEPSAMEDAAADRLQASFCPKGLPVFVMQNCHLLGHGGDKDKGKGKTQPWQHATNPSGIPETSRFGPPLKRRKTDGSGNDNEAANESLSAAPPATSAHGERLARTRRSPTSPRLGMAVAAFARGPVPPRTRMPISALLSPCPPPPPDVSISSMFPIV